MYLLAEEIDETQLWLEIIEDLEYIIPEKILHLKAECKELVKIMTAFTSLNYLKFKWHNFYY